MGTSGVQQDASGNLDVESRAKARHYLRVTDLARRHWLFLLLFTVGCALRVVVQVTYQPAIFFADSFHYLINAFHPEPDTRQPLGYSILLVRPLLAFHDLAVIPAVQHLLGLGMALGIYCLLLRHGVRRWLSAAAAVPVLFDAYQLQIEENIASDTFLQALVVAALLLLTWRRCPSPAAMAGAGLLVGASATVRFVGLPLLAVPVLYVLVVQQGWRRRAGGAALVALAGIVPLLVYSGWTYTHTGEFRPGGDQTSGKFMQARVSTFADCDTLAAGGAPNYILELCPKTPLSARPQSVKYHMRHPPYSAHPDIGAPPGLTLNTARREFALRVIANQPFDFANKVFSDFLRGFAWERTQQPGDWPLGTWKFPKDVRHGNWDRSEAVQQYGGSGPHVGQASTLLRAYQSVVYTRGPVFAAGVLLPALAALFTLAGLRGPRRGTLWAPALLVATSAVGLLLASAVFAFSWRYQLPAIPLLSWSAALGLAALFPRTLRHRPREVEAQDTASTS